MDPELQRILKKLLKLSVFVMALLAIYLLLVYVLPILGKVLMGLPRIFMPFIIAFILALLIEPVVRFMEKTFKFKRNWAVLFSLLLVLGGFVYLISLLISVIIREISSLYFLALSYSDEIIGQVMTSLNSIQVFFVKLDIPPQAEQTIQDTLKTALLMLQDLMNSLVNSLLQVFTMLPGMFVFLMIATVATYFIMKDRNILRKFFYGNLPDSARVKGRNVVAELMRALTGFLKAYFILISITTILTLVSLKILGVKYVLTIGIIVGMADILPVLGPGAIFVPWITWEFISGHPTMGISLLVVYILISAVRQFLEPKIVGDNIGLHPLATLISLYAGLQLGGIVGMVLGPVFVVIFIASYRAGLLERFDWRTKNN